MKRITFFRLFIISISFYASEAEAQTFYLLHEGPGDHCPAYVLYFGVRNRIILGEINNMPVKGFNLVADSVNIDRINDSLFLFSPHFMNGRAHVYVIDSFSKRIVDTIDLDGLDAPVRFYITPRVLFRDESRSANGYISSIDRIRMLLSHSDCYDYSSGLKILSYRVCLIRDREEIVAQTIKGRKKIREGFKRELLRNYKPGDVIALRDIKWKNQQGEVYTVAEEAVYKYF